MMVARKWALIVEIRPNEKKVALRITHHATTRVLLKQQPMATVFGAANAVSCHNICCLGSK